MLKRLIRYDLDFIINKVLVVYYAIALVLACMTRLFLSIENSFIFNLIGQICSGILISAICGIFINNVIRAWVRLSLNFYKDESYLTHTLPISKSTHYAAKFLSAVISMVVSLAAVLVAVFIAYYSKENVDMLLGSLAPLAQTLGATRWGLVLAVVSVFFEELLCMLQAGYIGIIAGGRFDSGKKAKSLLFGVLTYFVSQGVVLFSLFAAALFNDDIMRLFTDSAVVDLSLLKTLMLLSLIVYVAILIAEYFVGYLLFKKGVNVD